MHDVAVVFDDELLGDLARCRFGDAAHIVAPEIEQHQMLGALLGVGQQLRRQLAVLRRRGAAGPRAGDGADGHLVVAQAHQDFRARADDGETAEIEEEEEGRGIERAGAPGRARRAAG